MLPPVAILAGGLATRLYPLTQNIPKALVPVAGQPFIAHQLRLLARQGVARVVLCLGHLGEQIQAAIGEGKAFGLQVSYQFDGPRLLGTGGALKQALGKLDEVFFVLYGDSYLPIAFAPVWEAFQASKALGLMTVLHNRNQWGESNVIFKDGRILDYAKRRQPPGMAFIDYGLSLLRRSAWDTFSSQTAFDLAEVFEKLVAAGSLAGYEVKERFYEIGSPEGRQATENYLRAMAPSGQEESGQGGANHAELY
jgi:NDP-sugar pyrophosphorylase family protein